MSYPKRHAIKSCPKCTRCCRYGHLVEDCRAKTFANGEHIFPAVSTSTARISKSESSSGSLSLSSSFDNICCSQTNNNHILQYKIWILPPVNGIYFPHNIHASASRFSKIIGTLPYSGVVNVFRETCLKEWVIVIIENIKGYVQTRKNGKSYLTKISN